MALAARWSSLRVKEVKPKKEETSTTAKVGYIGVKEENINDDRVNIWYSM